MRKIALFLFMVCVPIALAQTEFYQYEDTSISLFVSSDIRVVKNSPDAKISYMDARLYFFPKDDYRHRVVSINAQPPAGIVDDYIKYSWNNPQDINTFSYTSLIKTTNDRKKIKTSIPFPVTDIEEDILPYLSSTEYIDSDDTAIIKKASELAEGEDNLYIVVAKIAAWIENNVEYDLNTLTAEVSQKASWVLENKNGVCDEITTLFIAMLRSVGIPAKYVSGISYTNYLDENDFGPHAWAEVYFPGYGWVEFDITYHQFGFIDTSHIKLKESTDSQEPTTRYTWKGYNIDLDTSKLTMSAIAQEKHGNIEPDVTLHSVAEKRNIGFGSYNLIRTEVTNTKDYYITTQLYISRSDKFKNVNGNSQTITLSPFEKKTVFWIIKLSDDLDAQFLYSFPVTVYSLRNATSDLSFNVAYDEPIYSDSDINDIIIQKSEEKSKVYSKNVYLTCHTKKQFFYVYEEALLNCTTKNIGNVYLNDLTICHDNTCRDFDLGISQTHHSIFLINVSDPGKTEQGITIKNKDISKADYVTIDVLDRPKIKIDSLEYPGEVHYEDDYKITFNFAKDSISIPYNVSITLQENAFSKEWHVEEFNTNQVFIINLLGQDLSPGENTFQVFITYHDANGKEYIQKEEFMIDLVDVTLLQKTVIFFNNLGRRIEALFR